MTRSIANFSGASSEPQPPPAANELLGKKKAVGSLRTVLYATNLYHWIVSVLRYTDCVGVYIEYYMMQKTILLNSHSLTAPDEASTKDGARTLRDEVELSERQAASMHLHLDLLLRQPLSR